MNFDELRTWYQNINWDSLRKTQFGELGDLNPVADALQRIKQSFDFLLASIRHKQVPSDLKNTLARCLSDWQTLVKEIDAYTDAAKRQEMCNEIRQFEYNLQQDFSHIFSYFLVQSEMEKGNTQKISPVSPVNEQQIIKLIKQHQPSGLKKQGVTELIDNTISTKFGDAKQVADYLLSERKNIDSAIAVSKKIIDSNEHLVKSILEANAADATNKAQEHKTLYFEVKENFLFTKIPIIKEVFSLLFYLFPYFKWITKIPVPKGAYVWLFASMFSGFLVISIVWYFIRVGEEVSVGNAILRISAIIVPSYFAVLFSRQFLNHKKLYEFYMFKKIASQTMISLRSQFQKGSSADEKVLEKGLNVLFNEPNLGDKNVEVNTALIKDLIDLLLRRTK